MAPARAGEVQRIAIDSRRSRGRELGWERASPLDDGLGRTVEWARDASCG